MKGYNLWSYDWYKPVVNEQGDIYICRVVPCENSIHVEWKPADNGEYTVYYRKREIEDFSVAGKTANTFFDIENLDTETDFEFFVQSGDKKSRVRLARTGKSIGTVVNYLHPDDNAYAFSGKFFGSPSILKHPDGYLLASMDLFGPEYPQNLTLIFRSDDNGETWHHLCELAPCFWGKMFLHKGEIYMIGCSTEYGDLLIGKSTDGGKTFGAPVTILRGENGKHFSCGFHTNPQNVFVQGGRLYKSLEWGNWQSNYYFAAMVMSCDVNDDLLDPESWSFTEPVKFDHFAPELEDLKKPMGTIEGTIVLSPEGKLFNIMRFTKRNYALVYEIDTQNPEAPLKYERLMHFEANLAKFMIHFDKVSNKYYTIASRLYEGSVDSARNLQSLMTSSDLFEWDVACDLYDFTHLDVQKNGLQYVNFEFDGDDIFYLCRTALNGANSFHDSNYFTFHRIKDFRKL